jgi:hypothetical protein
MRPLSLLTILALSVLLLLLLSGCDLKNGITQEPGLNLVGSYDTPGQANDIFIQGDYAYIADGSRGLLILDIASPYFPSFVASYNTPGPAYRVFVSEDYYCYVIYELSGNRLVNIYDIATPNNPSLAGNLDSTSADYLDIYAANHYAYVGAGSNGFKIYNMVDPTRPSLMGVINGFFPQNRIWLSGNYIYMTYYNTSGGKSRYQPINVSNPASPLLLTPVDLFNEPVHDFEVFNNYLYACFADSGLRILEVSNPTDPSLISGYDTYGQANDIFFYGANAFIADGSNGTMMINIANPNTPYLDGYYNASGSAQSVFVTGGYIFVACGSNGIEVLENIR